ncbi:MAG: hypothetical protein BLM47_03785 [Candidatus Reconcilbacillus cellulovorans]|uniref:DUF4340 domain-containing protein n=1 Tax=Candidatus Reconcilbacillus cellulovorans TaxID=1906605 RepID=A0A2A6E1W2_9BACL|nr:MAG: hypothetical protein BLM47_03785 [Candidatus Reconcilbacillus cellulovorans]
MRRLAPTLILVVLCVAAWLYARSQNYFQEKEETLAKLADPGDKEVTAVEVRSADGEVALEKNDGTWQMTKPSRLPVDPSAVEAWISSFRDVAPLSVVEANPADIAKYGLKDAKYELSVGLADGSGKELRIGDELPTGGAYYVMAGGDPKVYKVRSVFVDPLKKTAFDFMAKKAVEYDAAKLKTFRLTWKGETYTMVKSDPARMAHESDWKLNGRTISGADADGVLAKLGGLETNELVRPASEVRLTDPELLIELTNAESDGKETQAVYRGQIDGEVVRIVADGGAWAYAVPVANVQAVADALKEKLTASPSPSAEPSPAASPAVSPSPAGT